METMFCPRCRLEQPRDHTYCPACGAALPSHLLSARPAKDTRWFPGVRVAEADPESSFLRVSCYREDQVFEAPEGSVTIPGHHVRFSIWVGDQARCALSIPETEAVALASFITESLQRLQQPPAGSTL